MAKQRPKVNLARQVPPRSGDFEQLFTSADAPEQASGLQLVAVRVDAIRPDPGQPRRTFPEDSLHDLSQSIRQDGVIQPIEVTEIAAGKYLIVHGERRWRAAQQAGLTTIPAIVRRRDYDEVTRFVRQLVENIQREDLNDVDRAAGLLRLRELMQEELNAETRDLSQEQTPWASKITWAKVGKRLGYSRQRIHQLIQLLKLPEEIREAVRAGALSERDTRIYQGLRHTQQRQLHDWRMRGEVSNNELRQVAQRLKELPEMPLPEALREVRQPISRTAAPAPRPAGPARPNRQNLNRVHWARDHLSRIQLAGPLTDDEKEDLLHLLAQLAADVAVLVEQVQAVDVTADT